MNHNSEHTFSSLESEHADLERLFDRHQRALLARDVDAAVATINTFENRLKWHIGFEDEVLLPLYKVKAGEVEGGTLPIFQAEHRKLRESVATLARHTSALYTRPDLSGSILNLLDEEVLFKGLFSHHSLREHNLLFPRLDAVTSESEREKALEEHFV
jgi:hemerythrin-like domain-containing protein